ncbi:hypothetical protein D1007_57198 [Hordeum vulgare]|nr:hypothetical protein D1007_57198 [Hordeum vulgare]
MADDDSGSPRGGGGGGVREQDRFLPIANISRIMKKAVPANGKIAKDAKETLQECVSEFISFVTSEASDKCQKEKRKTINGDDLLWAMATLGFEEYVDPLKIYLQKYRDVIGDSKLTSKSGDGSVKKDIIGAHGGATSSNAQVMVQHGAYAQGMGYMQPQCNLQLSYSVADTSPPYITSTIMGIPETEDCGNFRKWVLLHEAAKALSSSVLNNA